MLDLPHAVMVLVTLAVVIACVLLHLSVLSWITDRLPAGAGSPGRAARPIISISYNKNSSKMRSPYTQGPADPENIEPLEVSSASRLPFLDKSRTGGGQTKAA